jgi:hypothetical protein
VTPAGGCLVNDELAESGGGMPQIQREGTIGVESVDMRTDLAASLEGILKEPVERVGSGRVEEGLATA